MQTDRRDRRATALWAAFGILSLVFATDLYTERALGRQRLTITRTQDVLRAVNDLRINLADAILARGSLSLGPVATADGSLDERVRVVRSDLKRLRALASDEPQLRAEIAHVTGRTDALLANLERSAAQARAAPLDAAAAARDQRTYRAIAGMLAQMRDAVVGLLTARRGAGRLISTRARAAEALGVVISVALLLYVFRKLRREIQLREHSERALRSAEQRLHAANVFLDSIVENLPNMLFVKEPDQLRLVRMNKAGEDLLGSPRGTMLGKNDFDLFPVEQAEFFQQKDRDVLTERRLLDIPLEPIQTPAGRRWLHTKKIPILDDAGQPLYLLGISEDVTEKQAIAEELLRAKADLEQRVEDRTRDLRAANDELKREVFERRQAEAALQQSEQQLRQAQKMEAIGRLAGGVAHDFNNLLSVILSYSQLVQRALPSDCSLRSEVEQITRAGLRATDLTRQLLAFSRQQMLVPKIVDLNSSLDSMDRMLRRLIGEDVELRTLPATGLGRVRVDPGQIEQVIVNLAINSRDAMPAGGMLTIETANVELDVAYSAAHPGVSPGPHVMLAVSDTGIGMDRDTQARIFEPFFTTKEQGKGTGLGLSTVFGIVQQSGGSVWVYSEPGQGTTFKIYLPRVNNQESHSSSTSFQRVVLSGTETVLLVEDDDQVRSLAQTVLERNGFRVISASGCEEALQVEAAFAEPIQLLLTDVVMPRMSGRQLAEQLSRQRPRMKVLFMSGYTDDTVVHHGVLDAGIQFLQKPLTPEGLTRKVREVLDTV